MDAVSSLSFCDDGTLWIASYLHGLARRGTDGSISYLGPPPGHGDGASAVACDPDGSVWVGFEWGGFGRWNGSSWWTIDQESPPPFAATSIVRAIQIDRWASPRTVYFSLEQTQYGPGGLVSYDGR
jgi:ligand-binding sensor domain-containing protein